MSWTAVASWSRIVWYPGNSQHRYGRKQQDCKRRPDYTVLLGNDEENASVQREFEAVFNASCRRQSVGLVPTVAAIVAAAVEAVEVLPKVEKKRVLKDWYNGRKEELNALRTSHNAAQVRLQKALAKGPVFEAELREELRLSRVRYKRAQHGARKARNDKLAQRLGPSGQDDMTSSRGLKDAKYERVLRRARTQDRK